MNQWLERYTQRKTVERFLFDVLRTPCVLQFSYDIEPQGRVSIRVLVLTDTGGNLFEHVTYVYKIAFAPDEVKANLNATIDAVLKGNSL
jgi:hypothetical protein